MRADQQLKVSLKEINDLKAALDEHAIVAITDPQGRITYVNDKFCAISKYSRDELLGQDHRIINSGYHSKAFIRNLWTTIARGKTWKGEIKNRAKDGSFYWVDTTIVPFLNEDGKIRQYVAIRADITERKRAEEQLKVSFKEIGDLKAALDEHAIVAITDPRGKITYVNDKFCAISKYSRDELIGQDHRIINSGHHPTEFIRDLWTTIAHGKTWFGEIKNKAKDGTYYWVDTTIVPFLNEHGQPRQYVAIRADITKLKNAEAAIRIQAGDLTRSNKDLEQFAYVASHDLQEPLRAVAGCLQVLQKRYQDKLDARADELIGHAVDGSRRMQALVEGLLAFSRVGTRSGEFKPVNGDEALDSALKNLATAIQESGASVTRDPFPTLKADPLQLTLLFQNLIGNAIKFRGDQPPQIHLSAAYHDGHWILSIKDNGIGIEPQYFERIFVIFQRLHTRKEYPGTGIGLSICKKIVERHGGRISVESIPGQGCTFRCSFPA